MKLLVVPVTPYQQNCALAWDEASGTGVIVDPGGDVDRIRAALDQAKFTPQRILLTHGHLDHAGGAAQLADELGIPIEGPHLGDKFLLDGLAEQAARQGFAPSGNVTPTRWLTEGDTVEIGPERFDVLFCPGHTPGHVVFVSPRLRIALVGDVLFQGSIGRTDFPYGDHEALVRGIREKLWPLGDDIAFLPGHGPASTFGDERRSNPFVGDRAG